MTINYRKYNSYEEYLEHQSSKLNKLLKKKNKWSQKVRPECFSKQVKRFFPRIENFIKYVKKGKIICLGARVGIEVVTFKRLGFKDTIGIDLNPGKDNKYVIKGDFHNMEFEDSSFDNAYCNCIDHVMDIRVFSKEVHRVLKDKGILILEISRIIDFIKKNRIKLIKTSKKKKFESFVCDNFNDIKKGFKEFKLINHFEVKDSRILAIFENIKNSKGEE